MIFVIYNSQGIPVYSTTNEIEAQTISDLENGYYREKP